MATELVQAKVNQRRLYLFAAFALFAGLFGMLLLIGFSNATTVDVQPEEAQQIAVVRMVDGIGTTWGNKLYSWSTNPTIEVSAKGFRPLRKTLQTEETGGVLRLELQALPGELYINTNPASDKTRWSVDAKMQLVAEFFKQDLFAGKYTVTIDSPYYQKKDISVTMQRGEPLRLSEDLQSVSGQLKIKTLPAGANVYINGELIGSSPLSLSRPGGAYQISISSGDFQTITDEVEITNSKSLIERDYRLLLKGGHIDVRVSPSGGKLLLDGKAVQSSGPLMVEAGRNHTLIYLKDGYFSQRANISLKAGETKKVSLTLKTELGTVRFFSSPNALVNLDGKEMGKTPLILKLSALPHQLVMHKKDYRSHQQILIPSSKSEQQIKVVLLTKLEARLSESPVMFTNKAGIELKLFKPDELFVMGAPRHEKGQRANEFLRTVKLNMPFYVSTHEISRDQYSRFKSVQGAKSEPVTSISWIEAAQYCNWLSQQEGIKLFYHIRGDRLIGFNIRSDGYRLPSEAEWEWLARKSSKSKQSRFTWGDETTIAKQAGNIADEHAKGVTAHYVPNYSDGYAGVAPVGSFPVEKMGLYDLTGNVSEWVHDVYTLMPMDKQVIELNPLGGTEGDTHTVKGSNWRSGRLTELRASYREGEKNGRDDLGFRVAKYVYGGINGEK